MSDRLEGLDSPGRTFFGLATMASGVQQLVTGNFVRLVPKLPAWVPAQSAWPYVVGVVLVAAGLAILTGPMARTAAAVVAAMILVIVVVLYPPSMVANPLIDRPLLWGFMYTNPLKCLALVGGAAILLGRLPDEPSVLSPLVRAIGRLEPLGAVLLAIFLIVCGIQHFWYSPFVVTLVPAWLPARMFWTYFTGASHPARDRRAEPRIRNGRSLRGPCLERSSAHRRRDPWSPVGAYRCSYACLSSLMSILVI
jgi:uncharacterized membrane protein